MANAVGVIARKGSAPNWVPNKVLTNLFGVTKPLNSEHRKVLEEAALDLVRCPH
jgi:hypothetical protein